MTIQVELLNLDQHRSVKVVYRDDKFAMGQPTGEKVESPAGVLLPGDKGSFWIHSNRELRVIEGNEE